MSLTAGSVVCEGTDSGGMSADPLAAGLVVCEGMSVDPLAAGLVVCEGTQ